MDGSADIARAVKGPFQPTLILHGGAGSITRANLSPSLYARYHSSLSTYLTSTYSLLQAGLNAVDAACHAVSRMEDDELFNCGKGSVFTEAGQIEMEASLMVSSVLSEKRALETLPGYVKRNAAVSLIRNTRHPILLAKEVLTMADHSDDGEVGERFSVGPRCHSSGLSMVDTQEAREGERSSDLTGKGNMHGHLSDTWVEEWGFKSRGLERKPKSWFWTRRRWEEHRRGLGKSADGREWQQKLQAQQNHEPCLLNKVSDGDPDWSCDSSKISENADCIRELPSQGTVGAVCMDSWGNICVATSTGGLTNKRAGRIGDTPTVGAGFWAESWDGTIADMFPIQLSIPQPSSDSRESCRQQESRSERLFESVGDATSFWIGDCLPESSAFLRAGSSDDSDQNLRQSSMPHSSHRYHTPIVEKQPSTPDRMCYLSERDAKTMSLNNGRGSLGIRNQQYSRATAISGTGNGDSFLRLVAARTATSIARYSSAAISLQHGVSKIAGPGGELQRSAGPRWGQTGEGEGGMIGIEATASSESQRYPDSMDVQGKMKSQFKANVVFDFNCGGMWRAYYVRDERTGQFQPKIMVFKEEY